MRSATLIGEVVSVTGAVVAVRLRDDMPSTLVYVEGQSYRIGQVGAFVRIPLGYTSLYAICTQVGAAAAPPQEHVEGAGQRWVTVALFGESLGDHFERGVSQYPTVGDEVHLVTQQDLAVIYSSAGSQGTITVGHVAAASGIPARLDLGRFVARHVAVVGATGSGKSNTMAILLNGIASDDYPAARVVIIDPHGEYGTAVGPRGRVFRVNADAAKDELELVVPFWALPFDELREIGLGTLQPGAEAAIRDEVLLRKKEAAKLLKRPPPETSLTSDSPIPFSIRRLWFDLDDFERQTFEKPGGEKKCNPVKAGDAEKLEPNIYPKAALGSAAPFRNPSPRQIGRQLELMRSRLSDARFRFLFEPGSDLTPTAGGATKGDLHSLVAKWVGHDRPITVLDVSGLPPEVFSAVVGTLLRIIYDMLFWAGDLPVSGRSQPLLVVLEEAHLFVQEGSVGPAAKAISRIAKEGRKYGVGLAVVTQRPTEVDSAVLSQCGTLIALRLTNQADRAKVQAAMHDDLGALAGLLPALRTGEGLVIGEAMPIPTRVRFFKAPNKPHGDDPPMPDAWRAPRPDPTSYEEALVNWRRQSLSALEEADDA
jgi:DNA helicase HerA-like ATPase